MTQAKPPFNTPQWAIIWKFLPLHVSGTAVHGRVSAQGGAVTGRHGSRRSYRVSSCTAPQGGPAQALKSLTTRDDDIKNICV